MSHMLPAQPDASALAELVRWAKAQGLPQRFIDRLPELARRDAATTCGIADALAELGYPWTANELRAVWAPLKDPP